MRRAVFTLCLLVGVAGCSSSAEQGPAYRVARSEARPAAAQAPAAGRAPEAPPADAARKIIYTATVELIVTDFDAAGAELLRLVDTHQGYVANSDVGVASGERRKATWTLRVPVAKFRPFLDAVAKLGHAVAQRTDSQDVTDEFIDLEARLKNKQEEEKRLRDHLQKSTGKLEDILAVEKELSRVRGEVEQTQGRMQKLSKLAELTTVTVTMQERTDYVPPTAPTFGSSVGGTFSESVGALVALGKFLLLVVVALAPWLPLLAVVGVAVFLWRRTRKVPPAADNPPTPR